MDGPEPPLTLCAEIASFEPLVTHAAPRIDGRPDDDLELRPNEVVIEPKGPTHFGGFSVKANHTFLNINAKDFAAQSEWWTAFIGRPWDREPMPSCREWSFTKDVLFQVLDSSLSRGGTTFTLHVPDLESELMRLEKAGIIVPKPVKVEGFDTLRYSEFADPEGNTVGLLDGR